MSSGSKGANSIEKRALSGIVSGGASFATSLLQAIVAVPFLLSIWGPEKYGVWIAFGSVVTLLATLDTGHQNFLGNLFNQEVVKGDAGVKLNLASGLRVAFLLGGLQVVIAAILIATGSLAPLLSISHERAQLEGIDFAFLSVVINWAVFGSIAGILGRVYPPYGRYSDAQWITVMQRITHFAMLIAVACVGGFLYLYSWGNWLFAILFAGVWFPAIAKNFPNLYPWWTGGNWKTAFCNVGKSSVLTLNGFISQFSMSGLNLIIAAKLDTAAIPMFTTVRTLANTFAQASGILTNPIRPDIIRYHMLGQPARVMDTFQACWFASGILINIGIVIASPFLSFVYEFWTRGQLEFDGPLFALLGLSISVRTAYSPLATYIAGLNKLRAQFVTDTTRTLVTLALPLALAWNFGLIAFGLGILLGELAAGVCYIYFCSEINGRQIPSFVGLTLLAVLFPIVTVASSLTAGFMLGLPLYLVSGVSICLLSAFYIFQWKMMNPEICQKFMLLMPSKLRKYMQGRD